MPTKPQPKRPVGRPKLYDGGEFYVALTQEQRDWITQQATRRAVYEGQVVRDLINAAMGKQ